MKQKCSVAWCDKEAYFPKVGMCKKHNQQVYRKGKAYLTENDLNEIITQDNYAEVILRTASGNESGRIKIDIEDVDKVKPYKWRKAARGYAISSTGVYMHRLINNTPTHLYTDHKSGDSLDNRKANLRNATTAENTQNRPGTVGASIYKGVSCNRNGSYRARINIARKEISLGTFKEEKLAVVAYNKAAIKYFGEFAYLNEVID